MASRYDLARADAERALAASPCSAPTTEVSEHAAALAALVDAPRLAAARGGLARRSAGRARHAGAGAMLAAHPALRAAHDETAAAEARIELAQRERYPGAGACSSAARGPAAPSAPPTSSASASEIPILDRTGAADVDKAVAEHGAARERERAAAAHRPGRVLASQREALELRREALARFERDVSERQSAFLEMAESAYRLGRGTLFELLDARRTQLEASARAHRAARRATARPQIELRALAGEL